MKPNNCKKTIKIDKKAEKMRETKLKLKPDAEVRAFAGDLFRLVYLGHLAETLADCLDSVGVEFGAVAGRMADVSLHETRRKLRRAVDMARGLRLMQRDLCTNIRECADGGLSDFADGVNGILEMFMPTADLSEESYTRLVARVTAAFESMRLGRESEPGMIADLCTRLSAGRNSTKR